MTDNPRLYRCGKDEFKSFKSKIRCLCGGVGLYHVERDAYFCEVTGTWLSSQCPDPECEFCVGRPETAR